MKYLLIIMLVSIGFGSCTPKHKYEIKKNWYTEKYYADSIIKQAKDTIIFIESESGNKITFFEYTEIDSTPNKK